MSLVDTAISVLAPHSCLVCGRDGRLICEWCVADAHVELPSRCYKCKRVTTDFALCDRCKHHTPLRHVWVRTQYDGVAKQLLQAYKFERARVAQALIADAMQETLPYLPAGTVVVPTPTATSRIRQRGYDHAWLLAREIAKNRQFGLARAVTHLSQSRQVGASRDKRLTQLADSLVVTKPAQITGKNVLIIDDVVTTGATLETMAKVLKAAGVKSVNALVFAQKQ